MASTPDFKTIIETLTCPTHNRHPELQLNDDDTLKLTCCCVEFNKQCYYILQKITSGQTIESTIAAWKKGNK